MLTRARLLRRLAGVPMNFPSQWHPAKSVQAMRFACALEEDQDVTFVVEHFEIDGFAVLEFEVAPVKE